MHNVDSDISDRYCRTRIFLSVDRPPVVLSLIFLAGGGKWRPDGARVYSTISAYKMVRLYSTYKHSCTVRYTCNQSRSTRTFHLSGEFVYHVDPSLHAPLSDLPRLATAVCSASCPIALHFRVAVSTTTNLEKRGMALLFSKC